MLRHEDNKKQLFVNCKSLHASLQGLLCTHIQSPLPQCTVLCYISKNFYGSWQIFREFFDIIYHLLSGGVGWHEHLFFFHFLFGELEVWMFQRMSCSIILIFISNSNINPETIGAYDNPEFPEATLSSFSKHVTYVSGTFRATCIVVCVFLNPLSLSYNDNLLAYLIRTLSMKPHRHYHTMGINMT